MGFADYFSRYPVSPAPQTSESDKNYVGGKNIGKGTDPLDSNRGKNPFDDSHSNKPISLSHLNKVLNKNIISEVIRFDNQSNRIKKIIQIQDWLA